MAGKEAEPDLHNVDYEDVLHLYRGWRKAEGALKEKNKELNALKIRVKQLQESHIKFRGQIQALESVKELFPLLGEIAERFDSMSGTRLECAIQASLVVPTFRRKSLV